MKILNPLKAAFGKGRFSRVKDVSYHQWEDAFGVEFDDGLSFLEPHSAIRKANKISAHAIVERVALDEELRHGFFIHYDTGEVAEVSWAFIRELPPQKPAKAKRSIKPLRSAPFLLALAQSLWLGAQAQTPINTGSDGHDGPLNPTNSIVIDMADHPDGIYHYTSVNIPGNVFVSFIPNANNSPVVWLVQSNCVINGGIGLDAGIERAGPGGFSGGTSGPNPSNGRGPGGGPAGVIDRRGGPASYGSLGITNTSATGTGNIYGNEFVLPLLGGSGGGGGPGGNGGGAILIAAASHIQLNGGIFVRGVGSYVLGGGLGSGGGGSGGAVRLVSHRIWGLGAIDAEGGRSDSGQGGSGRVRFDSYVNDFRGSVKAVWSQGFQAIILPGVGQDGQLTVASVAGVAVPPKPTGGLGTPDVVIPGNLPNPVTVVVRCLNVPLNTEITVEVIPANSAVIRAVGINNQGTQASSTATISLNLPRGGGMIHAKAVTGIAGRQGAGLQSTPTSRSLAQTGWTTDGERFSAVEITAALGGGQQIVYLTDSGKRYPLPFK